MATLPAAAALFLRGDVPASAPMIAVGTAAGALDAVRRSGPTLHGDQFGLNRQDALNGRVELELNDARSVASRARQKKEELWRWTPDTAQTPGYVRLDSPRSKLLATRRMGERVPYAGVSITPGVTRQNFAVISLTALDGKDLRSPGRILVTATGQAENTGMTWTSPAHDSVGSDWGKRPSVVEGVPATLVFDTPLTRVRTFALDHRGQRRARLTLDGDAHSTTLVLGAEHATLWYEVEILP